MTKEFVGCQGMAGADRLNKGEDFVKRRQRTSKSLTKTCSDTQGASGLKEGTMEIGGKKEVFFWRAVNNRQPDR